MKIIDINRKFKKGVDLLYRFVKNPILTYDDFVFFQFEKKSGIVTRGSVAYNELGIPLELMPHTYVSGGNIYLKRVLRKIEIKKTDSIIDLGCGLGSPLFYMAGFPFKNISGIEYSKLIFDSCKANIQKFNDPRINVFFGDAGAFDSFDDYNFIFMYNPFGVVTMERVISNICQSYRDNYRKISIIYKNPVYNDMIVQTGIFRRVSEHKTEDQNLIAVYVTD